MISVRLRTDIYSSLRDIEFVNYIAVAKVFLPTPHVQQPMCTAVNLYPLQTLEECVNEQFVVMLDAYRSSGGLAHKQEILSTFKRLGGPSSDALARWISNRELICFDWQGQVWLPLFQFDRRDRTPDLRLCPVLVELTQIYDDWEVAVWCSLPNPWLDQRVPVDTLPYDPGAVLEAARAERFALNG